MDRADSLLLIADGESAAPRMTDATPASPDPHKPDRFEQERLKKLEAIEALGLDPWGHRFDGHMRDCRPPAQRRRPRPASPGKPSVWPGGSCSATTRASSSSITCRTATGRIQLMVSKADVSETQWKLIENLDLADIVGVDGTLRSTNTGEVTVFVQELTMLGKSLAQPPEKFHGARDTEMLLRQRYLDLIYSEGVLPRMLKRTKIIESVRDTLRSTQLPRGGKARAAGDCRRRGGPPLHHAPQRARYSALSADCAGTAISSG